MTFLLTSLVTSADSFVMSLCFQSLVQVFLNSVLFFQAIIHVFSIFKLNILEDLFRDLTTEILSVSINPITCGERQGSG